MTPAAPPKSQRLKHVLLVAILMTAATAAAVYIGTRRLTTVPEKVEATPPAGAGMTLERIHQTATRDGRTEWSLDAVTARYVLTEKKVLLSDLKVLYFLKDGRKVQLTAERGEVFTDTNDMDAAGNVVIYNDLYRLETESVSYRHGPRLIESRAPVKITGKTGEINSDALIFDLNTNHLTLKGHVQGTLLNVENP